MRDAAEGTDARGPGLRLLGVLGEVLELLPQRDLMAADALDLRLPLGHGLPFGDQLPQGVEGGVVQPEVAAVGHQHRLTSPRQRREHGGEGDGDVPERDLEPEVEPVRIPAAGFLALADPQRRGPAQLGVVGAGAVLVDREVFERLEPGEDLVDEDGGLGIDQLLLIRAVPAGPELAHRRSEERRVGKGWRWPGAADDWYRI